MGMLGKLFGKEGEEQEREQHKKLPPRAKGGPVRKGSTGAVASALKCEVAFVLDRSGSMCSYEREAIDGFNDFVDGQQQVPGYAELTLCLFDDNISHPMNGIDIQDATHLDNHSYRLGGSTAMLDAIGKTMAEMMMRHSQDGHPGRVIMVILTDGEENASREYTLPVVKDMIQRAKAVYGWEFIVIGVGVNAQRIADNIGVDECCALPERATRGGVRRAFEASTRSVAHFRKTGEVKLLTGKTD